MAKQEFIPGTEPRTVPEVHKAIEEYVAARDARMDLGRVEVEKKNRLMDVMKKKGLTSYAVDGHEATLEIDESVKAKLVACEPVKP